MITYAQQALGADAVRQRTIFCNVSGRAAQGQRYAPTLIANLS